MCLQRARAEFDYAATARPFSTICYTPFASTSTSFRIYCLLGHKKLRVYLKNLGRISHSEKRTERNESRCTARVSLNGIFWVYCWLRLSLVPHWNVSLRTWSLLQTFLPYRQFFLSDLLCTKWKEIVRTLKHLWIMSNCLLDRLYIYQGQEERRCRNPT